MHKIYPRGITRFVKIALSAVTNRRLESTLPATKRTLSGGLDKTQPTHPLPAINYSTIDRLCLEKTLVSVPGGEGGTPIHKLYPGYMGMCRTLGYGFRAVLV